MKPSPEHIAHLEPNEVFVFGSNLAGVHGAGAAKLARKFGAVMGEGVGPHGQTYAIATKDEEINTIALNLIEYQIEDFLYYAKSHPKKTFLVTAIGCGLAGYKPKDIAPLFFRHEIPDNVRLPTSFIALSPAATSVIAAVKHGAGCASSKSCQSCQQPNPSGRS